MKAQAYIADNELFHFVGRSLVDIEAKYRLLTNVILREGLLRHPPFPPDPKAKTRPSSYSAVLTGSKWIGDLETESYDGDSENKIFENIVCFADIPLDALGLHISKYSQFGLSFSKTFLAERGARPVMYFPVWEKMAFASKSGKTTLAQIGRRLGEMFEGEYDLHPKLKREFILEFAAYIKPFDISLTLDDPDNYYTEREWRMLGYLSFCKSDIHRVVLPQAYRSRFIAEFPMLETKLYTLD